MAPRNFTFINRTGNPSSTHMKEDDMPTIRSHAMREVRRRRNPALKINSRRVPKIDSSKITNDEDQSYDASPVSRFPTISCSRALSGLQHGTAIGLDAFSTEVLQHLYYFVQGFKPLTFPISYIRHHCDVPRVALSQGNPAVLHALCAVSSIHQIVIRATKTTDDTLVLDDDRGRMERLFLYHKQQAIISLQVELSSSKAFRDPSSMATVALLLLIEALSGDTVTSNTHRRGFVELVERYGMPHESSDLMSSDVLMTDIKAATSSHSQPSMRPCIAWLVELDQLGSAMFVPHRPELVYLGSGFMTTKIHDSLNSALVPLLRSMRNLVNGVEQNFDMGIDVSGVDGVHVLALEYSLLSLQHQTGDKNDSVSRMSECCRIACLLYCNMFLWTLQKNTTLLRNLLSYLLAAMSLWAPKSGCDEEYSVLLWLYFIGSCATSSTETHRWCMAGMSDTFKWLDLKEEDELRSVLARFFYVDRLMEQHLTDCYHEIKVRLGRSASGSS